jgi:hypothetical protein
MMLLQLIKVGSVLLKVKIAGGRAVHDPVEQDARIRFLRYR